MSVITIGSKFKNYTVISSPYKYKGKLIVDCKCICGKIRKSPCGDLVKLNGCRLCVNLEKARQKIKVGDVYNSYTIISPVFRKDGRLRVECKCKCGKVKTIKTHNIKYLNMCCQCSLARKISIGDRFGDYIAISKPFYHNKKRKIRCKCKCGHINIFYTSQVKSLTNCYKCRKKSKYNRVNQKGDKKHRLTFLCYIENKDNTSSGKAKVRCDCNKTFIIPVENFGRTQTCGCLSRPGKTHYNYKGTDYVSGQYLSSVRRTASHRKIKFDIDIYYVTEILIKQNHKCNLSGLPISIGNPTKKTETTASIDRIDSNKGYIKGNIQWLHKDINIMKWNFEQDKFINLCYRIIKHKENLKI